MAENADEMLAVNKSVNKMVNSIAKLEMILQNKVELLSDCICEDCPIREMPQE